MQIDKSYPSVSVQPTRNFLLGFFLCCSLPLLLAKLAVDFSWFATGTASRGQWLEREVQLLPAKPSLSAKDSQISWYLVYVQGRHCDLACELALYTLQQVHASFSGQQQIIAVQLVAEQTPPQLSHFPGVGWQLRKQPSSDLDNQIFIVNRHGMAILRYPAIQNGASMLSIGKDIRTDLRWLLAFDRSGV